MVNSEFQLRVYSEFKWMGMTPFLFKFKVWSFPSYIRIYVYMLVLAKDRPNVMNACHFTYTTMPRRRTAGGMGAIRPRPDTGTLKS